MVWYGPDLKPGPPDPKADALLTEISRRLTTFANSLDLDQAPYDVGPDLDPNCLTLLNS